MVDWQGDKEHNKKDSPMQGAPAITGTYARITCIQSYPTFKDVLKRSRETYMHW